MVDSSLAKRVRNTLDQCRRELLAERTDEGYWKGELSASALSTATAVSAMSAVFIHDADKASDSLTKPIRLGIELLKRQQNIDGGFGDTNRSYSNIATSYLVLAASALSSKAIDFGLDDDATSHLKRYLKEQGELDGLRRRYGKDKTFVVPIMTNLAIAGLIPWDEVSALPFETAVFPQSMYRLLKMPVVSYAIPALVAIGQARHFHGPRTWLPLRIIRGASINRTVKVLRQMQPESGGYLEATPLTSFVVMSLAVTGRGNSDVSKEGLRFLLDSIRDDGSWPIDTNLATWVTSLAMTALARDPDDDRSWCTESLVRWHLDCQHHVRHPFTGAEPGGWGWTELSGAVPDADDTPAAILALHSIRESVSEDHISQIDVAINAGIKWLALLQNRDGGWPTFCRGWGKLPFDRSSTDLTAHAARAIGATEDNALTRTGSIDQRWQRRAKKFLEKNQAENGSWCPLWFGNQDREDEDNPVYGTARVLLSAEHAMLSNSSLQSGIMFLLNNQQNDGGWGGGPSVSAYHLSKFGNSNNAENLLQNDPKTTQSSVEETAVAIEALCLLAGKPLIDEVLDHAGKDRLQQAIIRGVECLLASVDEGRHHIPWPIGFYFAKLWYYEKLYPLVFTTAALASFLRIRARDRLGRVQ